MVSTYRNRPLYELQAVKEVLLAQMGSVSNEKAEELCQHLDAIECELQRRQKSSGPVEIGLPENGYEPVSQGGVVLGWLRWFGHGGDYYRAYARDGEGMVDLGNWPRLEDAVARIERWHEGQASEWVEAA